MQCMTFIAASVMCMHTSHAAQLASETACRGRRGSKAFTKANRAASGGLGPRCGPRCVLACVFQKLSLTRGRTVYWCASDHVKLLSLHATAIPSRTYPFSSDQGSQTGLGSTSTRLSDRPGTLGAVVFSVLFLVWSRRQLPSHSIAVQPGL